MSRLFSCYILSTDATSFVNKCTSKALQGHEIGVTRLELTDSVLVQGDLGKISEDALNLYFSNTTKSRGGDIKSLIWINRQKSLLVTFQQSDGEFSHFNQR